MLTRLIAHISINVHSRTYQIKYCHYKQAYITSYNSHYCTQCMTSHSRLRHRASLCRITDQQFRATNTERGSPRGQEITVVGPVIALTSASPRASPALGVTDARSRTPRVPWASRSGSDAVAEELPRGRLCTLREPRGRKQRH